MRFRDEFPEDCPPPEAREIREPIIVYRLSDRFPAKVQDFKSMWQRRPGDKDLMGVRECQAKDLSVFTDLADARGALQEKGSGYVVALELSAGMGGAPRNALPFAPIPLHMVARTQNRLR